MQPRLADPPEFKKLGGLRVSLALLHLVDFFFDMTVGREQIQISIEIIIEEKIPNFNTEPLRLVPLFRESIRR